MKKNGKKAENSKEISRRNKIIEDLKKGKIHMNNLSEKDLNLILDSEAFLSTIKQLYIEDPLMAYACHYDDSAYSNGYTSPSPYTC